MAEKTWLHDSPVFGRKVEERDLEAERHSWTAKQARSYGWQQVDLDQLRARPDGYVANDKSGRVYIEIQHQPLLSDRPQDEPVAVFAVAGRNDFRFFRLPPDGIRTVADLDRRDQEREQADADQALQEREQRARGPQRQLLLADLDGEPLPTLRAAAQQILDAGGRIHVDRHGRLTVSVPDPVAPLILPFGVPIGEPERRRELARAASVLAHAHELVLDALRQRNDRPLPARLADKQVSVTGTLA
jgi:hypothetical protein